MSPDCPLEQKLVIPANNQRFFLALLASLIDGYQ
jgi:hypothetical protein